MESTMDYAPNILVVDDVISNLVVLSEMIRAAGYVARPVTSAQQALIAIKAYEPQLILLDISMPDIDGYGFCTMLKNNVNTREIPIIFISALDSTEDKIKGLKLGVVDYITKPFIIEELTLRINTHLKIYKMQRELEIYNKKLYQIINDQMHKIYEGQKNIIYALTKLMEKKNDAIGKHLKSLGRNCRLLAMSLQFCSKYKSEVTNSFVDTIELVAPLHDIGMIAISDKMLLKKTKLSTQEMEIMKTHTDIGANTLKEIYSNNVHNEFLKMAADIARYHHEKWDGSGYPKGLSKNEIPLCARIVSIVDMYDTLISEKCYKRAYTHEESVKIINKESGISLDPDIVEFFNKIQKQWEKEDIEGIKMGLL